jgi:hypothetical protein
LPEGVLLLLWQQGPLRQLGADPIKGVPLRPLGQTHIIDPFLENHARHYDSQK